jgi:hypothetical protein
MSDLTSFLYAMWDATLAACIALNLVPMLILSGLVGVSQTRHRLYWLKASGIVVLSLILNALWPMAGGYQPIWPSLTQLEDEIQIIILWGLSYVIIRLLAWAKTSIALTLHHPRKA